MKVAILGSHGFIAGQLRELWNDIVPIISFSRFPEHDEVFFDLLQLEKVDFSRFDAIDYVLFLAGNSSLEACENNTNEIRKINVLATEAAIQKMIEHGCRVLFFSSDAVFGAQEGPFYETSTRKPISCYGKFKKTVEDDLGKWREVAIIRLSYVFCMKDKFTQYLMRCLQRKEQAEIYHPFSRTVISLTDLADLLIWVMRHWGEYSLINACGRNLVSRLDIANELATCWGEKIDYRITEMPSDFVRIRPPVTDMRSCYIETIMPEKFKETFSEKVQREYERYKRVEGDFHV